MMNTRIFALCTLVCLSGFSVADAQQPAVELLGVTRLNGDLCDLSGLDSKLETGTPANQLGGFSAIEYSGSGDRYFVLSDRGPGDGAATFPCRLHQFELQVDLPDKTIRTQLLKTTLLKNARGNQLNGSLNGLNGSTLDESIAFDCEGLRMLNGTSLVISDEYGPSVRMFEMDGKQKQRWTLPSEFKLCSQPTEPDAVGTFPNRGLEGLACSTDGAQLVVAMQGPLIQDGVVEGEKCLGLNTRWLLIDAKTRTGETSKQIVYTLTDESTGVSEVLAVDAHRYLVIERDSKIGAEAVIKHVYLADTRGASDVSAIKHLNRGELPLGVKAISKTLLIDLREERFGLGGDITAEKPEGICWGPPLPDGRRVLIVCVDNDFETSRQSELYAFALSL